MEISTLIFVQLFPCLGEIIWLVVKKYCFPSMSLIIIRQKVLHVVCFPSVSLIIIRQKVLGVVYSLHVVYCFGEKVPQCRLFRRSVYSGLQSTYKIPRPEYVEERIFLKNV